MMLADSDRVIASYDFEDGSTLRVVVKGKISTYAAIELAESLFKIKRQELDKLMSAPEKNP